MLDAAVAAAAVTLPDSSQASFSRPVGRDTIALDSNESPAPPDPPRRRDIVEHLADAVETLHRYPDPEARLLRGELARWVHHDTGARLGPEHVFVGNGSSEVLQTLFQFFGGPGRTAMTFGPTYPLYRRLARLTGTRLVEEPRDEAMRVDVRAARAAASRWSPDLIVVATPNNPTGTATDGAQLRSLAELAPVTVVDEAYAEFRCPDAFAAPSLVGDCPGLVVTRTLSKAFAAAGLRVGYAMADPATTEQVEATALPYRVSSLNQAAACAVLSDHAAVDRRLRSVREVRAGVYELLDAAGLAWMPSDANFVHVRPGGSTGDAVDALRAAGVLVKVSEVPGWLRITVGTAEQMAAAVRVLTREIEEL
ncbi:MAG: aminotransferase class I/II-fold pyridoxal phosphate-dependent enzyme [Nocardioides sp.]|uniref:pyridoxal phosphate-dependent aminotransferase n=1 Tax=Nocardioides sp. TaxID=35761 RepID=UPI0039E72B93